MQANARVAVITGAVGGLGSAIAQRLAQDGYTLVLTDRDAGVNQLATQLRAGGYKADALVADLADATQIQPLVDGVAALHGGCDVLVNNAGVHPLGREAGASDLENTSLENWQLAIAVNLTAPFLLSKAVFPRMKAQGWGRIINIASRAGRSFIPGTAPHYSATKAGIIGLTRSLAEKGAGFAVTCNAIAPGRFPSPLADSMPPDEIAASIKRIPLGRVGNPAELAATVSFLASDGAAYITGAVVDVNGGAFMG